MLGVFGNLLLTKCCIPKILPYGFVWCDSLMVTASYSLVLIYRNRSGRSASGAPFWRFLVLISQTALPQCGTFAR